MDEDKDNNKNESSKGPSNADAFSALETAMEWYKQQSECCHTQLLLLKRISDCNVTSRKHQHLVGFLCGPDTHTCICSYYAIPNVKDAELTAIDEDLHLLEVRIESLELPHLRNLKIPRLVLDSTLLEDDVELHSFCDASKKAYGAAIYLRTKSRNEISVKLVTSKAVAPLNCVTLPRLELLGALVAARLASKGNKTRWKQFVANRVNEITSLTDPHSWYHCAGKENPADFLSRGLSADCLVSNSRWWTGAEFLSDSEFPKNFQQVVSELDYLTEHEKETVVQERKKLPEADRSEETVLLCE
ncbi:integrase catalytic domain-containing protein [Trichonephila clavipes]|nr:integrase catalytic domain-containing protein [Trichonephila clavipes]